MSTAIANLTAFFGNAERAKKEGERLTWLIGIGLFVVIFGGDIPPAVQFGGVNMLPLILVLAIAAAIAAAELLFDAEWSILGVLVVLYLLGVAATAYLTRGAPLGTYHERTVFAIPYLGIGLLRLVAAFGYVLIHYSTRLFRAD